MPNGERKKWKGESISKQFCWDQRGVRHKLESWKLEKKRCIRTTLEQEVTPCVDAIVSSFLFFFLMVWVQNRKRWNWVRNLPVETKKRKSVRVIERNRVCKNDLSLNLWLLRPLFSGFRFQSSSLSLLFPQVSSFLSLLFSLEIFLLVSLHPYHLFILPDSLAIGHRFWWMILLFLSFPSRFHSSLLFGKWSIFES